MTIPTPPLAALGNGLFLIDRSEDLSARAVEVAAAMARADASVAAAAVDSDDDEARYWNLRDRAADHYRPYRVKGGVLTIPISGVLIAGADYMFAPYFTGYGYLLRAIARGAADPAVDTILLAVDSPGGMVSGCAQVGEAIFAARASKRIVAHAGDAAYSAAYWLASAAHEIVVAPNGGVGSIGVLTSHLDYSGAYEKWGVVKTYLFAGEHKVDEWAENAPLADDARDRILARIGRIYDRFVATVARNRGLEEAVVRGTEARVYLDDEAVEMGLADRVAFLDAAPLAAEAATPEEDDPMAQTQATTAVPGAEATTTAADASAPVLTRADLDAAASAAAVAERDRISSILNHDLAAKRPAAARQAAFTLGLDAATAATFLAAMPEERASVARDASGVIDALDAAGGSSVTTVETAEMSAEDEDDARVERTLVAMGRKRR